MIMKIRQYKTNYDEEADVLYISFGRPKKAIGIEIDEGNVVRVDPFNESILGITIIDFNYRYGKTPGSSIQEKTQIIVPEILAKFKKYRKARGPFISTRK
jgi:uncharacterized protein YuzE